MSPASRKGFLTNPLLVSGPPSLHVQGIVIAFRNLHSSFNKLLPLQMLSRLWEIFSLTLSLVLSFWTTFLHVKGIIAAFQNLRSSFNKFLPLQMLNRLWQIFSLSLLLVLIASSTTSATLNYHVEIKNPIANATFFALVPVDVIIDIKDSKRSQNKS